MKAEPMQTRYARQTVLKEIGPAGQEMLAGATTVIAGLGALGSNSANLLARAGVGTLRLVDRDIVDWTNLQRQCLFEEEDATRSLPKAEAAVRYLKRVNSAIRYEPFTEDINPGNIERIVAGATVVVDGLDNFYTRALLNQACVKHGIPWLYGACLGTYGTAATIIPGVSACLNCLLPEIGQAITPPLTCETVGVLGPVAVLVAAWQSSEALKIMVGKKDMVSPHLVHVDLWQNDFSTLPMTRVAGCAVCGQHKFDLLEHGSRLATASLCGRDAVQIVPPPSFNLDFDLLRQTLGRLFTLEQNPYLLKFRADDHDVVVFPDGRAMVFGTSDSNAALSLYGKYIGG
jgi:molybdopterin/thiamine biosynthesis adenylyltransferase